MNNQNQKNEDDSTASSMIQDIKPHTMNIAIVGGGRACKYFLNLIRSDPLHFLNMNIKGVCDINPEAEGFVLAKEMGIYTTTDYQDIFKIKNLDSILEITGSKEVLLNIISQRPKGVGVMEHNIGRLLRDLFDVVQRLELAEHRLGQKKMFSDFLIQQSSAAIVVLNTDFTIVETNEAYLKAVNKSKKEVIGRHCYQISHGLSAPCSSSKPELSCPMIETLRTGKSAHVIHEHPVPDGQPTYCDMVTYPLKNREGEIYQIIEMWSDITEELSNRWEKRVKKLKSDFQKLIQEDRMISLGKLAASCAHEINNPIQGLLTFSHLMQEILGEGEVSSEDLEQCKNHLSIMSEELDRCGKIVSGLISFSRESSLEFKDVDLNDVVNAVIELTRHRMKLQNIELIATLYPEPLVINGNNSRLYQCFLNVIFNSIEAMPEGGQLNITTELVKTKNNARLEIRDTGYGIPKDSLSHVFDPFFTTKREGEGTGMGLSIVYGITKNHKGAIKVSSDVGKGTSFVFTFPGLKAVRPDIS